jgi:hypothetical protein
MANKNKYQLMQTSETESDSNGNFYPDLTTFPINDFRPLTKSSEIELVQRYVQRYDIIAFNFFGSFTFYDDISLWLNDIQYISDEATNIGIKIKIYPKSDIDSWYLQYTS